MSSLDLDLDAGAPKVPTYPLPIGYYKWSSVSFDDLIEHANELGAAEVAAGKIPTSYLDERVGDIIIDLMELQTFTNEAEFDEEMAYHMTQKGFETGMLERVEQQRENSASNVLSKFASKHPFLAGVVGAWIGTSVIDHFKRR